MKTRLFTFLILLFMGSGLWAQETGIGAVEQNPVLEQVSQWAGQQQGELDAQKVVDYTKGVMAEGDITFGSAVAFTSFNHIYYDVKALDPTHFVVVWNDRADNAANAGKASIGTVSGTSVTFGSEYVFNSYKSMYNVVEVLSSSHFAILFYDYGNTTGGKTSFISGNVSGGNVISFGTKEETTMNSGGNFDLCKINSTQLLYAYRDGISNTGLYNVIVDVVGNNFTFGSPFQVMSTKSTTPAIKMLDASRFVVAYVATVNSSSIIAKIGTISGASISYGSSVNFYVNQLYNMTNITVLDAGHFVIGYINWIIPRYFYARAATVSGSSISFGSQVTVGIASSSNYYTVVKLYGNHVVFNYQIPAGGLWYSKYRTGTVTGNSITLLNEFTYGAASGAGLSQLDETHFVSLVLPSPTWNGNAVIGEVSLPQPPSVTTQAVSNINITTATGNGNITSLGDPNPTAHGVCWNTSGTPTTGDNSTNEGGASATGAFTSSMTSLTTNTTYYVRAYATNNTGTTYGNEVSFTTYASPTVSTQAVSGIGATSATGNGNITDLGNPGPTAHGVCWNTTGTPTTGDSSTDEGAATSTGAFTSGITGLSAYTTYYVRAYATNSGGTVYGAEVNFATLAVAPSVTTQAVSAIDIATATGNGNITGLGTPNPTAHGVCWNTTGTPTTGDSSTDEGAALATGAFTSNMSGLTGNTMYYVRAYATNVLGTVYGTEVSFTTLALPAVTTQAVTGIGSSSATGNGNITVLGNPAPTAHGVCWNTIGTPTTGDSSTDEGAAVGSGAFTSGITGLSANTTYYVRAYATNSSGTVYGAEVNFATVFGQVTWDGSTDTDWNTASNWDGNAVPLSSDNVIIAAVANQPIVGNGTSGTTNTLDIATGASINVLPGGWLTANATLTNNGAIVLESGASGTGSIIDNGFAGSGTFTAQRYLTADKWHGFAAPISDAVAGVFKLPYSYMPDVYLWQNNEATYDYTEIVPVATPVPAMQGYMVWVDGASASPAVTNWTFDFVGTPVSGSLGTAGNLSHTAPGGATYGWNLMGNSYASAIDWDASSGWTKTGIDATIYLYNGGTWATYSSSSGGVNGGSQYIASGQGFFVKVSNVGNGSLMMDNNVRTHNNASYLKSGTEALKLQVTNGERTDETGILFNSMASANFDNQYDAYKIISQTYGFPQIYSIGDVDYGMNVLPETESIDMNVSNAIDGAQLSISTVTNPDGVLLYLEDTYTGEITDLNQNVYVFTYFSDMESRFVLHFSALGTNDMSMDPKLRIYTSGSTIYVSGNNGDANLEVIDITGKVLSTHKLNEYDNNVTVDVIPGIYLVRVSSDLSISTKRVFLK